VGLHMHVHMHWLFVDVWDVWDVLEAQEVPISLLFLCKTILTAVEEGAFAEWTR